MDDKVNKIIDKLKFGDAILFTGAGFSYGMTNLKGLQPKGAEDLSTTLLKKLNQEIQLSLKDVVDYYISTEKASALIETLEDEFIINKVCNYHEFIAEIKWKRCYTTNYDFGFELACKNIGKKIRSINPLSSSDELRDGNVCIHINGDMNVLNNKTLKNEFALGDISYVNNNFDATYWFNLLKRDFDSASAIIFIGYSIYDDLIKKILSSNKYLKEKSFIITSPHATSGDMFRLGMYGNVINCGTEAFAINFIEKYKTVITPIKNVTTEFLTKHDYSDCNENENEITKIDINNFFLFGKIERNKIHQDYANYLLEKKSYFIPRRQYIEECLSKIRKGRNVLFVGEIGNGKSVLLEQLIHHASTNENLDVYIPNELDHSSIPRYNFDFDKIKNKGTKSIIICDNIDNNPYLISDFAMLKAEKINLVASVRSIEYDKVTPSGIDFDIINIDELSAEIDEISCKSEVDYLIDLIDILNFWNNDRISLPLSFKRKLIIEEFGAQISETFLDLFSSENIITRIGKYFDNIINDINKRDIIFLILLFKYLNIPIDNNIIKGVLKNDLVDSLLFQNDSSISLFYSNNKKDGFTNKSSIFCRTTLKYLFPNEYKIKQFLTLVEVIEWEKTRKNCEVDSNILHLKDSLIKEIMRFSNIDNLLKERQEKKKSLFTYYDNLILKANWLSRESHYWLQLAMAKMANEKFGDAQKDLDAAYNMAKKKQYLRYYSTSSIDTQQARLYIKKSLQEIHNAAIWDLFTKAHNLLTSCENDKYRYRQVKEYERFYNNKYAVLSVDNKKRFKSYCNYMLSEIDRLSDEDSGEYSIRSCNVILQGLVEKISGHN
ncbi:SIR2 family protein [Serratia ureilytica]|nr:SIR2 family protein [Serratia ureilytica]